MLPARRSQDRGLYWRLADDWRLFLWPAGPRDRGRICTGLTKMSNRSRYLRFFAGTSQISDAQSDDFTAVDQIDHVAWCALDPDEADMPGVAMARLRRDTDGATVVEWAAAIVDAYQRRGLGCALSALMCVLARARGIRTLRCSILEENLPMVEWLRRLGAVVRRQDGAQVIDLPVSELMIAPRDNESAESIDCTIREKSRELQT